MAIHFKNRMQLDEYIERIPMFKDVGMEAANYSLDNIRGFCEAIGSPHEQFKSVHVAGTNGKGTTAYLISEVLHRAGFRCGLFTSPHLIDYAERVSLNGTLISDEDMLRFFNEFREKIEAYHLSYFEISTALAFWYFADQGAEVAVIEAGLGGRLDATNIITPLVSVITSVSFDHKELLGDTLEQIAREKAGIIKKDGCVLVGHLPKSLHALIMDIANDRRAEFRTIEHLQAQYDDQIRIYDRGLWYELGNQFRERINRYNVATAWQALSMIRNHFRVEVDDRVRLFREIPPLAGRFEQLAGHDWFFSGAHNPEALESIRETLESVFPGRRPVIVCAAMRDKFNEEFKQFLRLSDRIIFYPMPAGRALTAEEFLLEVPDAEIMHPDDAKQILNDLSSELVIFAVSFYFYKIVKGLVES
jgi:dihydrofolate synthase/folylpolyglutamate synthase